MNSEARLRFFILPLLVLIGCRQAGAQVVFSAAASASKIGTADQLQVTYTVQDAQGLRSLNPGSAFKDFRILAGPFQSQNTSIQMSGGQTVQSTSYTFTFIVQPKHAGTLTIAPAVASDAGGHSYQSNPLQIEVVNGTVAARQPRRAAAANGFDDDFFNSDPFAQLRQQQAAMAQQMQSLSRQQRAAQPQASQPAAAIRDLSKDIFIRVDVDKKNVKLGEQITAAYKLYARLPMNVSISHLPSLNGFWTQDFDIPKQPKPMEEIVNGKKYQVFLLKKSALFPQQAGTLTLDPAEAEGIARVLQQAKRSASPFDDPFFQQAFGGSLLLSDPFFNDPFDGLSYEEVPVHIKSAPVSIRVNELPAGGRPAEYTGAVGSYSVAAKLDKNDITTDDVATLTLTISGSGNLHLFEAPKLHLPDGLDAYDPQFLDTITGRSTTISGQKVITYTIAARKPGEYTIPPVLFSWYDPSAGSYRSASGAAFRLRVKEGKGTPALAKTEVKSGDIDDGLNIPFAAKPLILSPVYWSLYMLPMLALIGVSVYRRRSDELSADTALARNRLANRIAQKRLSAAGARLQAGDARSFYEEVSKAIWLYLSDKLGIPISALGKGSAVAALSARGVPQSVREQIEKVVSECELALYTPGGSGTAQMQQTFSEAASIITGLERTLRAAPLHS